jgi:predicted secreted protein
LGSVNASNTLAVISMRLNENDSNKTVEIHIDDKLDIMLPAKPTKDYVWETTSLDTNILAQDSSHFIASDKIISAGGIEIIKFHAIATGKSKVKLIFHKPFERNVPPLKIFELTVIIK